MKELKNAIKLAVEANSKHKVKKVHYIRKEGADTLNGGDTLIIEIELKPKR